MSEPFACSNEFKVPKCFVYSSLLTSETVWHVRCFLVFPYTLYKCFLLFVCVCALCEFVLRLFAKSIQGNAILGGLSDIFFSGLINLPSFALPSVRVGCLWLSSQFILWRVSSSIWVLSVGSMSFIWNSFQMLWEAWFYLFIGGGGGWGRWVWGRAYRRNKAE